MGEIYRARASRLNRLNAIKALIVRGGAETLAVRRTCVPDRSDACPARGRRTARSKQFRVRPRIDNNLVKKICRGPGIPDVGQS